MNEICVCAAIKLADGRIVRGHRHDDCIGTVIKWRRAGQKIPDSDMEEQGFMTTRNRFVGRYEAMKLQRKAGIPSALYGDLRGDMLFSEDLY